MSSYTLGLALGENIVVWLQAGTVATVQMQDYEEAKWPSVKDLCNEQ